MFFTHVLTSNGLHFKSERRGALLCQQARHRPAAHPQQAPQHAFFDRNSKFRTACYLIGKTIWFQQVTQSKNTMRDVRKQKYSTSSTTVNTYSRIHS